MNLQQIRSLVAILRHQNFSIAAEKSGLSHSAISLQMKMLEEEFGHPLFDRSSRPPKLLESGRRAAELAEKALVIIEDIKRAGSGEAQVDRLAIGVVPTTLRDILPFILDKMQQNLPNTKISVKSGLSGDLISQVLNRDLDMAIVTAPDTLVKELRFHEIATEPLFIISSKSISAKNDEELLLNHRFIAFSRKTLLGQKISARLQSRGLFVDESMEINSLEAIERMVRDGYGISIVPQRFLAEPLSKNINCVPFCNPQEARRLVLIYREITEQNKSFRLIIDILDALAGSLKTS